MKKTIFAALAALSLTACAPMLTGLATLAGAPSSPAAVVTAGALAYRTGAVKPSVDAAVQRDDFCKLVYAKVYEPTDRGGSLAALECQLRRARDMTRDAYDAGNATSYDRAAREAVALGREMLALVKGN